MRVHVPINKPQPWVLPVTLVCLALGALIALMVISNSVKDETSADRITATPQEFTALQKENKQYEDEITKLRSEKDEAAKNSSSVSEKSAAVQKEIDDLRMRAGAAPVVGPGIIITIDDTTNTKFPTDSGDMKPMIMHDWDMMMLVNELRAAGAEAISINGERVTGMSPIRCVGPVLMVNSHQVAPPFKVLAIGKTDTLYGAVKLPQGVLDNLTLLGIQVQVEKKTSITLPALNVLAPLESSKIVTDPNAVKKEGGTGR